MKSLKISRSLLKAGHDTMKYVSSLSRSVVIILHGAKVDFRIILILFSFYAKRIMLSHRRKMQAISAQTSCSLLFIGVPLELVSSRLVFIDVHSCLTVFNPCSFVFICVYWSSTRLHSCCVLDQIDIFLSSSA